MDPEVKGEVRLDENDIDKCHWQTDMCARTHARTEGKEALGYPSFSRVKVAFLFVKSCSISRRLVSKKPDCRLHGTLSRV